MRYQHHPRPSRFQCVAFPPHPTIGLFNEDGELKSLQESEADVIRFHIEHHHGCMSAAARSLDIGRSTLYRKLYEIVRAEHAPKQYIG
ncbi:MAG: helix-turn-helix domain-containing protein [Minisyncoccota bacterium]